MRQIADATRIGISYLKAIEGGKIDKLPPGIYARSYIRQYARAIEYDEAELLRCFALTPDEEEDAAPPPAPVGLMNRFMQFIHPALHSRTEGSR